jgi:hypothetical protein
MTGFSYPCQKGEQVNISHHHSNNAGTELSNLRVFQEIALRLPYPPPTARQTYSAQATALHRLALCYLRAACSNSLPNQHFRVE